MYKIFFFLILKVHFFSFHQPHFADENLRSVKGKGPNCKATWEWDQAQMLPGD